MTNAAIEAKSLSSITSLAANPPARPQNGHLEPLVLYIARVPGSRDVFLSPIKPREKMVTAEDVESCFYYLHVSSAEDEVLLESVAAEQSQSEEEPPALPARPPPKVENALPDALRPAQPQLQNHPLPPIPPYPMDDGPPKIAAYGSSPNPSNVGMARKPVASTLQRKPVGIAAPPPMEETPPPVPIRPYLTQRPTMSTTAPIPASVPEVTLIRRNPVTGEQWNVGTITDPPAFEIGSDGRRSSLTSTRIRKSGQPLYLNITNPGYAKFGMNKEQLQGTSPDSSTPSLTFSNGTTDTTGPDPSFSRRMWLEGSLFEKKASTHRKSLSAEQPSAHLSARPTFDSRYTSDDSFQTGRPYGSEDQTAPSYLDPPEVRRLSLVGEQKRSNTRGYTFLSPWDGRCEFSSGTMGNSLKCRHLWHRNSLNPASSNPTQVSELRFNLPGGGPLASDKPTSRQRSPPRSPAAPGEKPSRRSRLLAKFSDKQSASFDVMPDIEARASAEYPEDSRMDLSLGQERAGGGFAGKQAKLGKLIVEGEGLMMLDLLVAANMALWFRAYEKYQG